MLKTFLGVRDRATDADNRLKKVRSMSDADERVRQAARIAQRRPRGGGAPPRGPRPDDHGNGGRGGGGRDTSGRGWPVRIALAAVAALAIGAGAYFGLAGGGDAVSAQDAASRTAAYQALVAGGGMPLRLVTAAEVDDAIASLPDSVSPAQRAELREAVDHGQVRLAWLTLWDTQAQDGDVLRFESAASFPVDVTALNAKTTIAVPFPADGVVKVTGVRDGGGGITIALESGAAHIDWPTMQPGDTLNLPVTPGY
jgi:hypothetical protein